MIKEDVKTGGASHISRCDIRERVYNAHTGDEQVSSHVGELRGRNIGDLPYCRHMGLNCHAV